MTTHRPDPRSTSTARPPAAAVWLLERRLHPDERDEILGDLTEQFARRAIERGQGTGRRWYWRQTMALVLGFAVHRRDVVSTSHERVRGRWAAGNVATDLRYAWRGLRHSRAFTAVALLTLTFGIGFSTAVFSLVGGIFIRPLPYADADRLVRLAEIRPGAAVPVVGGALSDTVTGLWIERHEALDAVTWYSASARSIVTPAGASNTTVADVGAAFFDVFRMRPMAGRFPAASDADLATPVAVLSERLWTSAFGGSHDAIGRTITVDGQAREIVGVAPRAFGMPSTGVDVWVRTPRRWPQPGAQRNVRGNVSAIGLLAASATPQLAEAEGTALAQLVALSEPGPEGDVEVSRIRVRRLKDDMVALVRPALLTLAGGMALVLLAACVNLANLLLARHTSRQRELGVRVALGASRWRIARPVLFEQVLLTSAGAVLGGALAWWLVRAAPAFAPADLPRLETLRFDAVAFGLAAAVSLVTTVVVAIVPVWQVRGVHVRDLTQTGRTRIGRGTRSADAFRGLLVAGQVALAVVLLVGALLIGRSMLVLLDVHPGYEPRGVLTLQASFPPDALRRQGLMSGFYTQLLDRLRRHPSVTSAGYTMALPLRQVGIRSGVYVVGRPILPPKDIGDMAISQAIDGDYLATVGTRVIRGRAFTPADTIDAEKVLLIDEVIARRHFPGEDPIGRQLIRARGEPWTIVGIVESVHATGLAASADPIIYVHAPQQSEVQSYFPTGSGLAVRVTGDPLDLVAYAREQARAVDPSIPLYNVARLSDLLSATIAQPRFVAIVLGLFAALALSTALLGLYGVLAYAVECRRAEFGVRRALGATGRHIVVLVAKRGAVLAGVGLAIGLAAGAGASRFMQSLLFGITPADPASFVGASALVLVVLAGATWHPLRRALRIDPARALRVD